jgi:hypothetical protein
MRPTLLALTLAWPALLAGPVALADSGSAELLELRNTILNLVDELVKQGVISAEKAEAMKREAALKAREQSAQAAIAAGRTTEAAPAAGGTEVVRVPYVPEFVKDEIRAEVRAELEDEVTKDVVAAGRAENWGSRLAFSGDLRLRGNGLYQEGGNNPTIPDFQAINEAGGPAAAGEEVFLNTTEDITRGQVRLRLGAEARLSDDFSAVMRLATGNDTDPTTRNQRLGTYNRAFDVFLDLAYLEWRPADPWTDQSFQVRAGRLPNPFYSTTLTIDDDLTFDGVTVGYRGRIAEGGPEAFANLGGFTLLAEEPNFIDGGSNDKAWWGLQLGLDVDITGDLGLVFATSYYDFVNVEGERNDFNSTSRDWTAPEFIAKGNTVFDIRNDLDPDTQLFALASEFELLNATFALDYAGFAPVHVTWRGDWVENLGFDESDVRQRVGTDVSGRTTGWFTQLEVGYPKVRAAREWQLFGGYRRLERDAVLDSFTDSDFHAGGTDAEGWVIGGFYGLAPDLWLRARWMSANEIDGAPAGFATDFAPYAVDVLQLDLNAQF